MTKDEAAVLIQEMKDKGTDITVSDSSNELAGKLAKNRYLGIEYDACKGGDRCWYVRGFDHWEGYREEETIWLVLSTGEDWKP